VEGGVVVDSDYSVSSITQRYRQIERWRELDNFKDHPPLTKWKIPLF